MGVQIAAWMAMLLVAAAQADKYDSDIGGIPLRIGDKESKDFTFKIRRDSHDIFVFGPECEKKDSCAKEGHKVYEPKKNDNGTEGVDVSYRGVTAKEWKDVSIKFSDVESAQTVLVGYRAAVATDKKSFDHDAYFGIRNHRDDAAFNGLVGTQDKGKQFLLIIPKDPKNSKSEAQILLGKDDDKACNKIDLQTTELSNNQGTWGVSVNVTFGDNSADVTVAPAFTKKFVVSSTIKSALFNKALAADDYNKLGDVVIQYGKIEIKIPKDQFYTEKDKKYEPNVDDKADGDDFDLGLTNDALKKYCVKLVKDDKKYTIGLSERKNSVGLVSMSVGVVIGMLALLRF